MFTSFFLFFGVKIAMVF